ncbi:FecR family protein [Cellulophaga fucicola]|uniref:FecR family protein n=1 Tax=Cellulophaga fucicola TaxID=76595 RepID=A0A1K1MWR7_9FLAO|nr:FecR domain-containing protein [Cellulophaga fucicola]SFW27618.1 FecR family protein [Cellulophaga fucicola]
MDNKKKHILKLIANYTAKDISLKELEELEDWINQDNKNKATFNSYVTIYKRAKEANFVKQTNTEYAWNSIVTKLNNTEKFTVDSKKAKENRLHSFIKYAVAASIIFVAGFLYINKTKEVKEDLKDSPAIVVQEPILPGTDKAILTLANGTSVALEKGENYKKDNLNSNGEELVYSPSSSKEIAFNYLTVPRGGQFFVQLADGTKVWLNSDSKLKYPENFTEGKVREVELVYGEAYFDVSPSTDHKGARFKVLSKYQDIEVLGTEFNVKAYTDEDKIYTTLVEGKVSLEKENVKSFLAPGQQAVTKQGIGEVTVQYIDVAAEISWKKGLFTFKRESLKQIMKTLSRWYNVDVVFLNKDLENIEFKGVFNKKQTIEEVLTLIQNTNFINQYKIDGQTVLIN